MKTRAAKFVVAVIASILSSANLSAAPDDAEQTADKCQTSPGDSAPAGSRWRYRIERGTGRHCWFLKSDSEKAARKAGEDTAATAEETAPPPRKKAAAPRSVSDARAEFSQVPLEPEAAAPAQRPSAPAPSIFDSIPRPTVSNAPAATTRASDPMSSAAPAPAVAAAADQTAEPQPAPSATTPPSRSMPRAVPPASAAEKPLSLPMLITIIAGGMSVAGVIMSMLFGWRASRSPRLTRAAPMPPLELPNEPRKPARRRAAPARPPASDRDAA